MKNFLADNINPSYLITAADFVQMLDLYQIPRDYYVITNMFDGFRFGFLDEYDEEIGDVIIHHSSRGIPESYRFPWDGDGISVMTTGEMAAAIHELYYD